MIFSSTYRPFSYISLRIEADIIKYAAFLKFLNRSLIGTKIANKERNIYNIIFDIISTYIKKIIPM